MKKSYRDKYRWKPWRENSFELFENEKKILEELLADIKNTIHFIGSSSIPGVGGKGFIDIYIATEDKEGCKDMLVVEGYDFRLDSGGDGRLFLKKTFNDGNEHLVYHIHITDYENQNLKDVIAFRDFLRSNENYAIMYSEIKKKASMKALKQSNEDDAERVYKKTKEPLINKILLFCDTDS